MNDKVKIRLTKKVGDGDEAKYLDVTRIAIGDPDDPWYRDEFARDCLDMLRELHDAAAEAEQQ